MIDWDALNERYPNQPEFVRNLLAKVLSSQAGTSARIRSAARNGDVEQMLFLCHRLKGMAGAVEAKQLAAQALAAETAARAANHDAARQAELLADSLEALLHELEHRLSAPPAG
jgi:HPt (histidine-containing phosphotransfer) domain-containing protein